ncbi:hypothetical protein SRB521_00674 [Intestinimonas butyriciproducens]|nr:hypothetical protein SRB521_00674 [Intestinimonas butyriciproducens]
MAVADNNVTSHIKCLHLNQNLWKKPPRRLVKRRSSFFLVSSE